MYTLRLISAVLHRERGAAVRKESLDLRLGELALLVPLVAILLALSAWPAVDQRPPRSRPAPLRRPRRRRRRDRRRLDPDPAVDWLALSPSLALLAASAICLLGAVLVPRRAERAFSAVFAGAGFVAAGVLAGVVFDRSPEQQQLIADSMTRDRLAALTQILVAGFGLAAVLVSWGDRRRDHVGEYYALLAAAGGGMAFFVSAGNLMTLFLGLEWFSIALYILVALDTHRKESLEAGLKYLIVGSLGSAILLFGSALTYGATGELGFDAIRDATGRRRPDLRRRDGDDHRGPRVQGLGGAVPHVDAGRLRGRADARDRVHVGRDEGGRARRHAPRPRDGVPRAGGDLVDRGRRASPCASLVIGNLAALAQRNVKRLLAYSSVSQAGLHADRDRRGQRARRQGAVLLPRSPTARRRSARSRSSPRASGSSAAR